MFFFFFYILDEKLKTVFEGGERMKKDGQIEIQDELTTDSKIKLIRAHVLRYSFHYYYYYYYIIF